MVDIESKWDENVSQSRELYRNRHGHQMQIAGLCLEVCTITRGGPVKEGTYTLKRFAKEVGMNVQTLSQWVCVKKNVYDKLDTTTKHTSKFTALAHIAKYVSSETSPGEVNSRMKKYLQGNDYEAKIMRYAADLRAVAHNFESPSNIERCSQKLLEEIYYYARLITFSLKKSRRKLTPQEHGISSKIQLRPSSIDTDKKLQTKYYLDDLGFKIKITTKDLKILKYLEKEKKPLTPTEIGSELTSLPKSSTSAWAYRSLTKWESLKKVKRLKGGKYEYINGGE